MRKEWNDIWINKLDIRNEYKARNDGEMPLILVDNGIDLTYNKFVELLYNAYCKGDAFKRHVVVSLANIFHNCISNDIHEFVLSTKQYELLLRAVNGSYSPRR